MTIRVELPADRDAEIDLTALPASPGVFSFEDDRGRTISLAISANVRRLVRSRLATDADGGASRRVDLRAIAHRVAAMPVGSSFEAEWAYLQLARASLAETYRSVLDRWRGWFIHANPKVEFPRFVKTAAPGSPPTGRQGIYLGPFSDKHAAQRTIELVQDMFDLCRYYHILVEAPNAAPCAYKEMGKCPAPCDGSVTMGAYRLMMRKAIEFLASPIGDSLHAMKTSVSEASERLDFERARAIQQRLDAAQELAKPQYRFVDRLDRFRFVAVAPSERAGLARLFLISGGWIAPVIDLPLDATTEHIEAATGGFERLADEHPVSLADAWVENIGLVCRHLFQPAKSRDPRTTFLPTAHGLEQSDLRKALRRVGRDQGTGEADVEGGIADSIIEGVE
jgi:DNA polymerase-3 subunit epsilon